LAEGRSDDFRNAHNLEGPPVDQQFVADGIDARKQLRGRSLPIMVTGARL